MPTHGRLVELLNAMEHRRALGEQVRIEDVTPDPLEREALRQMLQDLESGKVSVRKVREPSAPSEPRRPVIPGFEFLEHLGSGAGGHVWKARMRLSTGAPRIVAIKVIPNAILGPAGTANLAKERIYGEINTLAKHPHHDIVRIYDSGEFAGGVYYTMECLEGGTLDKLPAVIREMPLEVRHKWFATTLVRAAMAIQYLHEQAGTVHRDIKPGNILLTTGQPKAIRPKIADFGLARDLTRDTRLTVTGAIFGTPAYMAPEIAAGKNQGVKAELGDIFGLGATLFHLLTGRPPFSGRNYVETMGAARKGAYSWTPEERRTIAPGLLLICDKCLRAVPEDRYPSAGELAEDLTRWVEGKPPTARREGRREKLRRLWRYEPLKLALIAVSFFAVLGLIGLGLSALYLREERAAARRELERTAAVEAYNRRAKAIDELTRRFAEISAVWPYDQAYAKHLLDQTESWIQDVADDQTYREMRDRWAALCSLGADYLTSPPHSRETQSFYTTRERFRAMAISPAGPVLATLGDDTTPASFRRLPAEARKCYVRVWDATTGDLIHDLQGHEFDSPSRSALAFSPDGRWLASAVVIRGRGANDMTEVKIWDARTGKDHSVRYWNVSDIRCLAFSPDGRYLAAGSGASDDDLPRISSPSGPRAVARMGLWDLSREAKAEGRTIETGAVAVTSLSFDGQGRFLVASLATAKETGAPPGGQFRMWSTTDLEPCPGGERTTGDAGDWPVAACHPEGAGVLWSDNGRLLFWDRETQKSTEFSEWVGSKTPLGRYKAVPAGATTPAARYEFESVGFLNWSPDGRLVAVGFTSGRAGGRVEVISIHEKRLLTRYDHALALSPSTLTGLSLSSRGDRDVVCSVANWLTPPGRRSGALVCRRLHDGADLIRPPADRMIPVRVTSAGAEVALFGAEKPNRIDVTSWLIRRDVGRGDDRTLAAYPCVSPNALHPADAPLATQALAIAPDGRSALSAHAFGRGPTLVAWDLVTGEPQHEIPGRVYAPDPRFSLRSVDLVGATALLNGGHTLAWSVEDAVYVADTRSKQVRQIWPHPTPEITLRVRTAAPHPNSMPAGTGAEPSLPQRPMDPNPRSPTAGGAKLSGGTLSPVSRLAFSPDGTWLAVGLDHVQDLSKTTAQELVIIRVASGEVGWRTTAVSSGPILGLAFSQDGRGIAVARPTTDRPAAFRTAVNWFTPECLSLK